MHCPLVLIVVASMAYAPLPMPSGKGHATPQACFRAYIAAEDHADHKAYVACLTDEAIGVRNGYLMYLAAFDVLHTRERMLELGKVMEKHKVPRHHLESAIPAMNKAQGRLNRSKRTAKDWEEYRIASKALSAIVEDQPGFTVDVMSALWPRKTGGGRGRDLPITKERRVGRYAELAVEFDSGPNHIVWAIQCVKGKDGWKMMSLPLVKNIVPPLPED
jgi:hypothetical protein